MEPQEDAAEPKYDLEDRLIDFASRVIDVAEALPNTRAGNHVAGQLVRCGTSPMANHAEAQGGESRDDFIHKIRVGQKELREVRVWLKLVRRKAYITPDQDLTSLLSECDELIAIFVTSVRTAERNRAARKATR